MGKCVRSARDFNSISKPNMHFVVFMDKYPVHYRFYRGPSA